MKRTLKKLLREYYVQTPEPPVGAREQTVLLARRSMAGQYGREPGISFREFFWTQAAFIRKRVWLAQIATLVFCGAKLLLDQNAPNNIGMISAILPFLFLAGTGELSRNFVYCTAEMELSTRFTLYQAMLSRITLLGMADVLFLTLASVMTVTCLSANLLHVAMYFCVPFLITSCGGLLILNHVRSRECTYYCCVWGGGVMVVSLCLAEWMPALYERSLFWCWCLAFAAALSGSVLQCRRLFRRCKKMYFALSF